MSTSGNEDQNQRNTPVMEDSPSMRIEFLRARLLSERSVSRTAKQRADELTKKVAELEEQLNTVSLQRKEAEKATAAVLAILENHGIGDASDGFDSGSDQDAVMCESNVSDSKDEPKEARDNDGETYSSSEIDSSPSTGRSLSWKSDRESLHSSNRKKYIDSARRSSSFASTGTSSKHVGKSCRRIRRRETRSTVEESYSKTSMHAARDNSGTTHTQDLLGSADFGTESRRDGLEHHAKSGQLEFPAFQVLENQNCTHEGDGDMEKALQHQAKLIGQYEDEERAQREWEEKYRENTSFMPDSCDLGNHSDVTEERDDMKASEQPSSSKTLCSRDQECKPERVDRHSSGVQVAPNDFQPPALDKMKSNKTVVSESSSPEFAFPVSNGNLDPVHSETSAHAPPYSFHQSSHLSALSANPSEHASSSSDGSNLQKHDTSGGKYELALISHETNKNVRNVLEALEQAKASLRQKLHSIPQIAGAPSAEAAGPSFPAAKCESGRPATGDLRPATCALRRCQLRTSGLSANSNISILSIICRRRKLRRESAKMASALRDLQRDLESKANDLSQLQKDIAKNHQVRKKYTIQLGENELVLKELDLLNEEANVYKLIGPVLVKQDLAEARANVKKRIDYISAELKRLDATLQDLEEKQNSKKETIYKLQQRIQSTQAGKSKA